MSKLDARHGATSAMDGVAPTEIVPFARNEPVSNTTRPLFCGLSAYRNFPSGDKAAVQYGDHGPLNLATWRHVFMLTIRKS